MRRVLLVFTALACLTAATSASAQRRVAILGLEVSAKGTNVDMPAIKLAASVTNELRSLPGQLIDDHRLAANSNRGLTEMKLLSGCDSEGTECMASIGQNLGADLLVFGKIVSLRDGARIVIQLVDVAKKTRVRSVTLPFDKDAEAGSVAATLYRKLFNLRAIGSLTVSTNATTATVVIDGKAVTLSGGSAHIDSLDAGLHQVAVRSPGYRREAREIEIRAGMNERAHFDLEAISSVADPVSTDEAPSHRGSRIAFWAALSVGAAAGVFQAVNYFVLQKGAEDDKDAALRRMAEATGGAASRDYQALSAAGDPRTTSSGEVKFGNVCSPAKSVLNAEGSPSQELLSLVDACDRGDRSELLTYTSVGVMVAAGAAASIFYYRGYISEPEDEDDRSMVRVTPTVTPNSIAAGLSIDF